MSEPETTPLRINGVGRDADYERSLILYLSRRPTDDEIRRLHDYLSGLQSQ